MRAAIALVLAGCGGGAATKPAAMAPPAHVEPAARTSAPPTVAWGASGAELSGLPAIAAAGEVVVLPIVDADHGPPSLRVEVRGTDDHVLQTLPVLAPGEAATLARGGEATAALTARIAATNHELVTLHGVHDLRALRELPVEPGHDGEDQHWATGDNLDVEWRDHHLRVFRHNNTQALADRDGTGWVPTPASPACVGKTEPFLRAAYHAPAGTTLPVAGNMIVVAIAYRGTDACPAPTAQLHVVSWAGAH